MSTKIKSVEINKIDIHTAVNGTVNPSQVERMKFLLNQFNQHTPIQVIQKDDRYILINGRIRFKASVELGWKFINVEIVDWLEDEIREKRMLGNVSSKRSYKEIAEDIIYLKTKLGKSQGKKRDTQTIADEFGVENNEELENASKDLNKLICYLLDLDIEKSTADKIVELYEGTFNPEPQIEALDFFGMIDNGEISIDSAYQKFKQIKSEVPNWGKNQITDVVEYSTEPINDDDRHQVYTHTNDDMYFLSPNIVNLAVISPEYAGKQKTYEEAKYDFSKSPLGMEKDVNEYVKRTVKLCREIRRLLTEDGNLVVIIGDKYKNGNWAVPHRIVVQMLEDGWFFHDHLLTRWIKPDQRYQNSINRLQPAGEHILHFSKNSMAKWKEFKKWKTGEQPKWASTSGTDYVDGMKRKNKYIILPHERLRNFIDNQNLERMIYESGFNKMEIKEFGNTNHPCPFPWTIAALPILLMTDINDTVLDCCSGIGSTAYAAKILHRKSISVDIGPAYNKFNVDRLNKCEHHVLTQPQLELIESNFQLISYSKNQFAA